MWRSEIVFEALFIRGNFACTCKMGISLITKTSPWVREGSETLLVKGRTYEHCHRYGSTTNGGSDFDSYIEVIPLALKPTHGCSSLRFWEEQTKSNACQSMHLTQSHTVRFINQKHQWKKKSKPWRRERVAFHMQPRHICPPITC